MSQTQILSTIYPKKEERNYYHILFDKNYNIFRLENSLDLHFLSKVGETQITHLYYGNTLTGNFFSARDDEAFSLRNILPLAKKTSLVFEGNYLLNSDSRNIGINRAERINGNVGFKASLSNNANFQTLLGYEANRQLNIYSNCLRFLTNLEIKNYELENFKIDGSSTFELLNFDDNRKNRDFRGDLSVSGQFDKDNFLIFGINAYNYFRNYLASPIFDRFFFDQRNERKVTPTVRLSYLIMQNLNLSLGINFSKLDIYRKYNKFDPTNNYSAVTKKLTEETISIFTQLKLNTSHFEGNIALNFYHRNEENSLDRIYNIDDNIFQQMLLMEFQKNNTQNNLILSGELLTKLGRKDTIGIISNIGILRYDTPSNLNDDDRDELSMKGILFHKHRFQSNLSLETSFEISMNHLVFLKASKSIFNNWNRIIKLKLNPNFHSKLFSMSPSFEVLANYTVYDFETSNENLRSYILRQLSIRDSIFLYFTPNHYLFSNFIIRFNERGILFWNDFAMTRETNITEIFARLLYFTKAIPSLDLGIGLRIYNIYQKDFERISPKLKYELYSISPETEIKIFFDEDKTIILQGWYEIKFWNYTIQSKISNVILQIKYRI